jgi:hypothetical protein
MWKHSNLMDLRIFLELFDCYSQNRMGDTCLPGLQGFPVQITGWSGFTDRVSIVVPNDIQLQFSPGNSPRQLNTNTGEITQHGNSTFFMNGIQFSVRQIRICKPKQEGLASRSGNPIAEFQIWGFPVGTVKSILELAVLIIPVFLNPTESEFGKSIVSMITGKSASLESTIPSGNGADILKYTTCIETNTNTTVKISVAYWTNGANIIQEMFKQFPANLPPAGIPDIFGFRVLSSFVQFADEKRTKGQRQYSDIQSILQPYTNSISLSTNSPEFRSAFRLIQNFEIKRGKALQDTSAYKCVAIDRSRDIKDGKLLIDPASGRRLDEEVQEVETQEAEVMGKVEPSTSARSIWMTVCIVLGVILGLGILFGLIYMISVHIFTRKSLELPPSNAVTAATMARMPEGM